jgi:DNA uptake protein ComE-like DNA-binding protein
MAMPTNLGFLSGILPKDDGGPMKYLLAGLGTGVAIGLLVAPQSGEDTRRRFASTGRAARNGTRKQLARLKQVAGKPQNAIFGLKRHAKSAARKAKELASDAGEQVKTSAQSLASTVGAGPLLLLNTASREDLLSIYGIGPVLAEKIIDSRPYASAHDVVDRGILPENTFREITRSFKSA